MADAPPIGPCKLCRTTSELRRSHILPRWAYRRLNHVASPTRAEPPVRIRDGIAVITGEQITEHMLCDACERRFGRWEDYVAGISLHPDDSFPALEAVKIIGTAGACAWAVADASELECDKIARFSASVIWRASVSLAFPHVSLGPYADDIATYLRTDGAPMPDCARLIVELFYLKGRPRADQGVVGPAVSKEPGFHAHRVYLFGMGLNLCVGGMLPANLAEHCIARHRRVAISDGEHHVQAAFARFAGSAPRGQFADLVKRLRAS